MVACSEPCFVDPSAAAFTDPRLRSRLQTLLEQLDRHPGCSLPQACQGWAATKAAYRFFAHPQTTVAHLLPAFVGPAVRRAGPLWSSAAAPGRAPSAPATTPCRGTRASAG